MTAKAFLATEQRIPGLGNGVLQDILWTAKIHPKSIIAEMAALGGRDTERDLFGQWGGYKTILSKNTVGQPCPACGSDIRKEAFLGRAIYYCEGCQKV